MSGFSHVRTGDKFSVDAPTWNAILDAGRGQRTKVGMSNGASKGKGSGNKNVEYFRHVIEGDDFSLRDFSIDIFAEDIGAYTVSDLGYAGAYNAGIFSNSFDMSSLSDGIYQVCLKITYYEYDTSPTVEIKLFADVRAVNSDGYPYQTETCIDEDEMYNTGEDSEGDYYYYTIPIGFLSIDTGVYKSKNTYRVAPMSVSFYNEQDLISGEDTLPDGAQGDILYYDATESAWVVLAANDRTYGLLNMDLETTPEWFNGVEGAILKFDSNKQPSNLVGVNVGDMLFYNGSGWTLLSAGSVGDVLVMGSSGPEWETPEEC